MTENASLLPSAERQRDRTVRSALQNAPFRTAIWAVPQRETAHITG